MRTKVAIIGAGPAGLLLGQLLHSLRHRQRHPGAPDAGIRARPHPRRRARAGHGRACSTRSAPARARTARAWSTTASSSPSAARATASTCTPPTGKTVMIYGQTEVTRDLMNARKAAGLTTVYEAADVTPHDFDSDHPRVTYVKDGADPRDRLRLHRRLRRLPRRQPRQRPAVGDPDLRAGLSVRLARHPVGDAAGVATN